MSNTPDIDIRPDHWEIVRAILREHVPQYEVWAFGSRAKWTAKEFSDIDLAIISDEPLPKEVSAALADAFDESDLPYKVDVVDWAEIKGNFRNVIEQSKVVVQKGVSGVADTTKAPTLGEVISLVRGTTYKSALLGKPGPVLLGLGSIQRHGGFRSDSLKTYGGESPSKMLLTPGDLYVSLKDVTQSAELLGAIAQVPNPVASGRLTQDTVKLDFGNSRYPRDLLYWTLRTPHYRSYCRSHATGTTNLGLPREDFLAYRLPSPTRETIALAEVLTLLDDKIELNRRMNETLESMARAIFKDWFVDFGPVRAKAEGRQPKGMNEDIAAAFPVSFGAEGIPTTWRIVPLTALSHEIRRGVTPKYTERDGICILNQKCIRDFRIEYTYSKLHNNQQRNHESRYLQQGDILVNSTGVGTLGRVAQFWGAIEPMLADSHITIVRPQIQKISPYYLGIAVSRQQRQIELLGEGSTGQTELSRHRLGELTILQPSEKAQQLFDSVSSPLIQKMQRNELHTLSLAQLRDTLLPKLISGELRIKDAEKFVAEVV